MSQSTVENVYQNSLLADAAYIDLVVGDDVDTNGKILDKAAEKFYQRGFTLDQFEAFQSKYKIYKPAGGELAHQQNTLDGFAVTIFEDIDTGKLTVAFRGTEPVGELPPDGLPLVDLIQDVLLGLGFSSTLAQVMQTGRIDSFLEDAGLVDRDGNVNPAFVGKVDFAGHSLGGHLTLMAAYYYPDLLDHAYTYNGAGTTLLDSIYLDHIKPVIGDLMGSTVLSPDQVTNIYAEPGLEVTANEFPFLRDSQGERFGVFI